MTEGTTLEDHARTLAARYRGLEGEALLGPLILEEFAGRIVVLSSFGAESALLLHMVAGIDRATPVVFIDTGKLFGETLRYRDALARRLGLADLRVIGPDAAEVARRDPAGTLWHSDADACCALRKIEPLERALAGFDACIAGRKRYQGGSRGSLAMIEFAGRRVQIDPLAGYTRARIEQEFKRRDLPPHPLEADGFLSIGCMPCTDRVAPDEDPRAGRWRGLGKTECGIHHAVGRSAGRPA
jgi:phosphoadenosine phosphosulfate reductase